MRCLLVELETSLAQRVTERLMTSSVEVATAGAAGLVERLVAAPPHVAVVNLVLTQGSGFGLVNRVLRMEALAGLDIVLVAEDATQDVIDAHKEGATPAAAYVRRLVGTTREEFAESIVLDIKRLLGPVEIDPLAAVVSELGFRVLRRLRDEEGGAVFACMDDELHRAVAIKLMKPSSTSGSTSGGAGDSEERERLARFQRERRILALLRSPHIVTVYGAGAHRGTPYLVRELIDGESLADHVEREGSFDVSTALAYARATALGLKHAAGVGVIHRDVRPHNIHVVDGHAKIARFGMGKRDAPDEARITQAGVQLQGAAHGDMTYVAPERVRGQEDARGDIYALGVTLHTLIAGVPPFTKTMPINVLTGAFIEKPIALDTAKPGTPPKVVVLVARLMAEDPAARPQSYDEVLALIDDATRSAGVPGVIDVGPAEPDAVHGTLRLMSVFEIVQSLELARRSATVFLSPSAADAQAQEQAQKDEGKLAFDGGRLVHAAVGALRGEEAFYALVQRKRGAFRVQYAPFTLERNVETPTTALLLEAARREDHASQFPSPAPSPSSDSSPIIAIDPRSEVSAPNVSAAVDAAFLAPVSDAPETLGGDEVIALDELRAAGLRTPPRHVHPALGLVIIAVVATAAAFGTMTFDVSPENILGSVGLGSASVESDGARDVEAERALALLVDKTRTQLQDARTQLATMSPRLSALEEQQASVASADAAAQQRAVDLQKALEAALATDIAARRFTVRLSDDGKEAVVELAEPALFNGDPDDVTADGSAMLARIAAAVAPLRGVKVRVEGHTDDGAPRGKHRNNWSVSGARATSVAKTLADQGIAAARVKVSALADTVPLVPNKGPKGRARNRRIELHLEDTAVIAAVP